MFSREIKRSRRSDPKRVRDSSEHFNIQPEDAQIRSWFVVDLFTDSVRELMAPQELCRRLVGDQAHGLRKKLLALGRVERLSLLRQELVDRGIGIADPRRTAALEVLL